MDYRLRKIVEEQRGFPGNVLNQTRLDRELERINATPTQRANVLAIIHYPEWLRREKIMYQEVREAFRDDNAAREILLNQDINPVKFLYSDLREGENQPPLDQVRAVLLNVDIFDIDPDDILPIELPNLTTVDASNVESTERMIGEIDLLNQLFPFKGKRRKIIMPKILDEPIHDLKILGDKELIILRQIIGDEWRLVIGRLDIHKLSLTGARILSEVVDCEELEINFSELTNLGLQALAQIDSLKKLTIDGHRSVITDDGLRFLIDRKTIQQVSFIDAPKISGIAFKGSRHEEIQSLALMEGITDEGLLAIVESCPNLEKLNITRSQVNAKGFEALPKLKKLKYLSIKDCGGVDDSTYRILAQIQSLEDLECSENILTDVDLATLAKLKNLKLLHLDNCEGMTRAGLKKFKQALPECGIKGEETIVF